MPTAPPTALVTFVMVSVCPPSPPGPALSFPVRAANGMVRVPESSATSGSVSSAAVAGSFTSDTWTVRVAVAGSA